MDELLNAITSVGFPIVMCGILCYYIFKIESELIKSIQANTLELAKLIAQISTLLDEGGEKNV